MEQARPVQLPMARDSIPDPEHPHPPLLPCNVALDGQLGAVFDAPSRRNGAGWTFCCMHRMALKEALLGRLTDCTGDRFAEAMLVSCHSFIQMAQFAEPLMGGGGSLITLTFYGAEKVVDHYNVMGPVKAALEASVLYLAHELGNPRQRHFGRRRRAACRVRQRAFR
jgi:enoyl-[acyl-carrier protein] reductase I